MENASKALIIAGAVLIAILVISLGVNVFNSLSGTVRQETNMDKEKKAAFNAQINPFLGSNISSSQVNELIQKVRTIDQSALKGMKNVVWVEIYLNSSSHPLVKKSADGKSVTSENVPSNQYYTVEAKYNNGLYTEIIVK